MYCARHIKNGAAAVRARISNLKASDKWSLLLSATLLIIYVALRLRFYLNSDIHSTSSETLKYAGKMSWCIELGTSFWAGAKPPMVPLMFLPIGLVALSYPHAVLTWYADPLEIERHALVATVQLRLGLLLLSGCLLDYLTNRIRLSTDMKLERHLCLEQCTNKNGET